MLWVQGIVQQRRGGVSRRKFLEVGALGGLTLAGMRATAAGQGRGDPSFGRAKRCLLLFLMGGPPQIDTFDPKPAAPAEVRGELSPISTRVRGLAFSELFPKLAQQALDAGIEGDVPGRPSRGSARGRVAEGPQPARGIDHVDGPHLLEVVVVGGYPEDRHDPGSAP